MCLKRNLLERTGDFWTKFGCNEALDVKIGAVDSNYGKKGIGKDMIDVNFSLGKVLGLKVKVRNIVLKRR